MQQPSFHDGTALRQVNVRGAPPRQHGEMAKLIFQCTGTGLTVQVWLTDEAVDADSYEAVTCPACARVHLVNKTTGKMLSDKEEKMPRDTS